MDINGSLLIQDMFINHNIMINKSGWILHTAINTKAANYWAVGREKNHKYFMPGFELGLLAP